VEILGDIFGFYGAVGLLGIFSCIETNGLFLWHLYQWYHYLVVLEPTAGKAAKETTWQ